MAETFWCDRAVFVTDVCHAVKSSKSTTIKAIDRLVRDKVLDRRNDKIDKRRKILTISRTFKPKLLSYIDEIIACFMLGDIIEKIGDDRTFSPSQAGHLLSSLRDAQIPIMIHAEDGEILLISKEWERLTGYKHNDIPTIEKWTEKAFAKNNTVSQVRKLISDLYKIKDENFDGTADVYTKGGEVLTWSFRSAPLGRLSDGRANIISIASDITDSSLP